MQRVTAALVTYQGAHLIDDLAETMGMLPDVSCVVYDSGSSDGTVRLLEEKIPHAKVISGRNLGFGFGNNRCLEKIETEYTLLLNSDARIDSGSLSLLVQFLDANPSYAGVQPLIRLWDWKLVTASRGVFLTQYGEAWDSGFMHLEPFVSRVPFEVPAITAAVALWRTRVIKSAGGFDQNFFMYFEDADLSLRLQAKGWKLAVVPSAVAEHMTGASSSRMEALLWEVSSSVRIFKRYFNREDYLWKLFCRELRVLLGRMIRGGNPVPRLKAFLKALGKRVETVEIPERIFSMVYGSPGDMPMKRRLPDCRSPFLYGSVASPWTAAKLNSDEASITLESTGHTATGVILSGEGELLQRFVVPAGGKRNYLLAVPGRVVYIKCHMCEDSVKVEIV